MKKQLYFKSVDDVICYPLEGHLAEAKSEGLKKIKLIKAERDTVTNDYVWCTHHGDVVDKCDCTKAQCSYYQANKGGRGVCVNRGKLYLHGEEVEFEVL